MKEKPILERLELDLLSKTVVRMKGSDVTLVDLVINFLAEKAQLLKMM